MFIETNSRGEWELGKCLNRFSLITHSMTALIFNQIGSSFTYIFNTLLLKFRGDLVLLSPSLVAERIYLTAFQQKL